ncbi:hypothetical protein NQ315_002446 [Exocentrus adspersus]|uniref:EB domain-containing protein n=1 Tax=Exocentrus adspersus TaxID=1586481 RepID=A0AAV8VJ07_9CUCU|nr:hypothetical protein NQ315_002446 [Exocentrus adspersus]
MSLALAYTSIVTIKDIAVTPQLCEKVEDCLGLVGAKCVDGVCTCNQSRVCEKVVGKIATQIGESCINDDNCNIDQAACNNKTCTCKPGYIKSSDERSCLLVSARIGDSCEESVQCYTKIPFSGCQENKCVCQQHTHDFNGLCYRDVDYHRLDQ